MAKTKTTKTKRKPFRTYLAYRLMRAALWFDAEWVTYAAGRMVRERLEYHLRHIQEQGWDYEEEPEPEHITVTYH